jgi:hypothetical protein
MFMRSKIVPTFDSKTGFRNEETKTWKQHSRAVLGINFRKREAEKACTIASN